MKLRIRRILLGAALVCAAAALLQYPQEAAAGAKKGMQYCLDILVPSLFPFMVLSVFVVKVGFAAAIGRLFEPVCRVCFALPGCAASAILMSMVGGYPVGARAAAALAEEGAITREQGERMLCFCVNAGPAFVISVVGAGLLHSPAAGAILLAAQIAACLLLGVASSLGEPRAKRPAAPAPCAPSAAQALIASAADASRSILSMCAFVVLFAAALALLRLGVPSGAPAVLLSSLMEVTGGCCDAAQAGAPLWFFALATGWGGLCVQFQILATAGALRPPLPKFILCRALHGALAALVTLALCRVFPQEAAVFSNTARPLQAGMASSVPACAALLFLCAVLFMESARLPPKSGKNGNSSVTGSSRAGML